MDVESESACKSGTYFSGRAWIVGFENIAQRDRTGSLYAFVQRANDLRRHSPKRSSIVKLLLAAKYAL
jgi:hypothetical protein